MAWAVLRKGAGTGPQPSMVFLPFSQTQKWALCPSVSPEASPEASELTRFGAKLEPRVEMRRACSWEAE